MSSAERISTDQSGQQSHDPQYGTNWGSSQVDEELRIHYKVADLSGVYDLSISLLNLVREQEAQGVRFGFFNEANSTFQPILLIDTQEPSTESTSEKEQQP